MVDMTCTERLNKIVAEQRQKYPIDESTLEWWVKQVPECYRIKSLRGSYEVSVKCPGIPYAGWSVRKTEAEAKESALARLYYARDYAL